MNWNNIVRDNSVNNEDLIAKARKGDSQAKEMLFTNNLPLVRKFARKWIDKGSRISLDNLISAGGIALIKTYEIYDFEYGFKFSTLLVKVLRNEFNLAERYTNNLRFTKYKTISMEQKIDDSEDDFHAMVGVEQIDDTEIAAKKEEIVKLMARFEKVATKKELEIIHKHYYENVTLTEIAKEWGVTRQCVSAIHIRALNQFRMIVDGKCNDMAAKTPKPIVNQSGVKGIVWDTYKNVWRVKVRENGKERQIGRFKVLTDAINHKYTYLNKQLSV